MLKDSKGVEIYIILNIMLISKQYKLGIFILFPMWIKYIRYTPRVVAGLCGLAFLAAFPWLGFGKSITFKGPQGPPVNLVWNHQLVKAASGKLSVAARNFFQSNSLKDVRWEGVAISGSQWFHSILSLLNEDQKAFVDLVILHIQGQDVLLERSFFLQQETLLAFRAGISEQTPTFFLGVVQRARLPVHLKKLFEDVTVSEVRSIVLTSNDVHFKAFKLTNRTNPVAVRGENFFRQQCMGCHASSTTSALGSWDVSSPVFGSIAKHQHLHPLVSTESAQNGLKHYFNSMRSSVPTTHK